jgi:hypothetical protein
LLQVRTRYEYDRVFPQTSSQEEVGTCFAHLLVLFALLHCCLLASWLVLIVACATIQCGTYNQVFEAVQPLCISVLDGYNVCIFAYGQTGSGKTFTMEGSAGNRGVSPRAIAELLGQIESMKDNFVYTVTLSMLEIYNETILDLLSPSSGSGGSKEKLDIRQTPDGNQVVGLTETVVRMPKVQKI